jgi:DNA invertase Pin-like site-specific DNA recombinase
MGRGGDRKSGKHHKSTDIAKIMAAFRDTVSRKTGVAEVARATGYSRTTIYRVLYNYAEQQGLPGGFHWEIWQHYLKHHDGV